MGLIMAHLKYFRPDCCVVCGSTNRTSTFPYFEPHVIDSNGVAFGTEFWFCSYDCFLMELHALLERRFWPGSKGHEDDDLLYRLGDLEHNNPDAFDWFGNLKENHWVARETRKIVQEWRAKRDQEIRQKALSIKHALEWQADRNRRIEAVKAELERWERDREDVDYWFN